MGCPNKLKAVIFKNFKIRIHHWIITLCEILLPIILFLTLSIIRTKTDGLEKKYIDYPSYGSELTSEELYNDKFYHETKVYFSPNTPFTSELMYQIQLKFFLNVADIKGFHTESEMSKNIDSDAESVIAVVFENLEENEVPKHLKYSIRPYEKYVQWDTKVLFNQFETYIPDSGSEIYINRGFLAFQMALESSFIEMLSNKSLPVNIVVEEFPYPPHLENSESKIIIQYLLPLLMALSYTMLCPLIISRVMEDKVSGMKVMMKVMGLKSCVTWITWFIDMFFWNFISFVTIAFILVYVKSENYDALLEHSNVTVLIVLFALYSSTVITFSFALSSFFNRPLYAMTVGVVLWVTTYGISQSWIDNQILCSHKYLLLVFPNFGLVSGYKIISEYETRAIGVQWSNIFESASGQSKIDTIGSTFIAFAVQIFIFILTIAYMDRSRPKHYDTTRPWSLLSLFFKNMKKKEETTEIAKPNNNEYVETYDLPRSVSLRNLTKWYGNYRAVNNVSIDFYQQQITVVLGKNGAGKTTTLSMIAGMLQPSQGNVTFTNTPSVSICPQHDLQFHSLTVLDHLKFYGILKGLSVAQALEEANYIIKLMNLSSKVNSLPSALSGGMQRKLSIAMAVMGSSNVVILDEPTASLDPESRRDIWDILIALRGYRTIIISTHLMEEAEVLGDQIAIIDNGELKCYGSPFFLRQKLGVGSYITIYLKNSMNIENFKSEICDNINVACETNEGELKLLFSNSTNDKIKDALHWLESSDFMNDIKEIRLTKMTMEELFLRASSIGSEYKTPSFDKNTPLEVGSKDRIGLCKQFTTLLIKWFKFSHYKLHLMQILILTGIVLICSYVSEHSETTSTSHSLTLDLNMYGKSTVLITDKQNGVLHDFVSYYTNMVKGYNADLQIVNNVKHEIVQSGIRNIEFYKKHMIVAADFNIINGDATITAMHSNKALHGAPISLNLITNSVLKTLMNDDYSITVSNHPLPTLNQQRIEHCSMIRVLLIWLVFLPFGALLMAGIFLLCPQIERSSKIKHLQLMCGVSKFLYWFTCYIKDLIIYASSVTIVMVILYFANKKLSNIFVNDEIAALFLILIAFGISVIPYSYLYSYKKSAFTGYSLFLIVTLTFSTIFMTIIYYLQFSNEDGLEEHGEIWYNIFMVFPSFGLKYTVTQLIRKAVWNYNWDIKSAEHKDAVCAARYNPCCDGNDSESCLNYKSYFTGDDSITNNIFKMLASSLLYFAVLCIVESKISLNTIRRLFKYRQSNKNSKDIETERLISDQYLDVNIDSNKPILKDIQFKAEAGEYLGLLGVNGAGKTTTFQVLTAEKPLESGEINMKTTNNEQELSIRKNQDKYLQNIGYCPQFESFGELADGETLLRLFATLRNVENVEAEVKNILETFDLKNYSKQQCNTYSGGCKRKLFTAIALIGVPSFIILDEPTAGVDPDSRRKMWDTFLMLKKCNPSIILSTHSMEECEVLCKKVVSIKSGKVQLSGSGLINDLKSQYKDYYAITLKLKVLILISTPQENSTEKLHRNSKVNNDDQRMKNLKECFENKFSDCEVLDEHPTLLKYRIKKYYRPLSEIFSTIEEIKDDNQIVEDYDISEVTLETLFLNVMKSEN